jgi:hypothetical protein
MTSSPSTSAIAYFCKELREARAYQQVTLAEVASATRVTVAYLDALEQGRWDEIPRAYLRGYLGLYAQAVGMNREKVLRGFDHLVLPTAIGSAAVLDETPALLSQPEDVGVTRAKIRATWFALLSRNRRFVYGLTFLVVAGVLVLLYLSRRGGREAIWEMPFSQSLAENEMKVHGPLRVVPVEGGSEGAVQTDRRGCWVQFVGVEAGSIEAQADGGQIIQFRFRCFDTLRFQYLSSFRAWVWPGLAATGHVDTTAVEPVRSRGDTVMFELDARSKLSTSLAGDSGHSGTVD